MFENVWNSNHKGYCLHGREENKSPWATTTSLYLKPAAGRGLLTELCMESVEPRNLEQSGQSHSFQTETPVLTEHALTLSRSMTVMGVVHVSVHKYSSL